MQRIGSATARADLMGPGKSGFHDNTDLSGQDATYLTPDWLNAVQEELASTIEGFGEALDPSQNNQLYLVLSSLFSGVSSQITNLTDQVNSLETDLANYEDIAVGDLFLTLNNFSNSAAVAAHKGYGEWVRYGDGQALITLANESNSDAESWMKMLESGGSGNTRTLTVEQLPPHTHKYENTWGGAPNDKTILRNYTGHSADDITDSVVEETTSEVGQGQPISVVQAGITLAAWKRVN